MNVTVDNKRAFDPPYEDYPVDFPVFSNEAEEREFWATHEITPYWGQLEDVTNAPPAELVAGPGPGQSTATKRPSGSKKELLSLRFPDEMISGVRKIAESKHLPYQTLLRSWVGERLEQELAELDTNERTQKRVS